MIKRKKLFKIALSFLLIGAVLMGLGYVLGGSKAIFYNGNGINISNSNDMVTERKAIDDFKNINICANYSEVKIEKGDKYEIETIYNKEYGDISCEVSDNTLIVNENSKKNRSFNISFFNFKEINNRNKITIYVPDGTELEYLEGNIDAGDMTVNSINPKDINIECDYGEVELGDINCTNMKVHNKSGDIQIYNINSDEVVTTSNYGDVEINNIQSKSFTCDLDAGQMKFGNLSIEKAAITNSFGDIIGKNLLSNGTDIVSQSGTIDISGTLKGKNVIDCEFGDVDIESSLSENDYSYNLDTNFGECTVNGKERGNSFEKTGDSCENVINAVCNSGDLNIKFAK